MSLHDTKVETGMSMHAPHPRADSSELDPLDDNTLFLTPAQQISAIFEQNNYSSVPPASNGTLKAGIEVISLPTHPIETQEQDTKHAWGAGDHAHSSFPRLGVERSALNTASPPLKHADSELKQDDLHSKSALSSLLKSSVEDTRVETHLKEIPTQHQSGNNLPHILQRKKINDDKKDKNVNDNQNEETTVVSLDSKVIALSDLGVEEFHMQHYSLALLLLGQAYQMIPKPREFWSEAGWILIHMGEAEIEQGHYEKALHWYNKALNCAPMIDKPLAHAYVHKQMGVAAYELGNLQQAAFDLAFAYLSTNDFSLFKDDQDPKYANLAKMQIKHPSHLSQTQTQSTLL